MASKIEAEIEEMDPNSWDRFTEMESAQEVEYYIADIKDMMGLNEGTIEEKYNKFTHKIAEKFAEYMSKKEGRDFTVTPNSVDEYSFDLDVDGLRYEGGSYLIKGDNIINVAVSGNPVYAKLNQLEEGYDEFKRVEKGKKKTVAKDKGEEDVYGAGVKKGEQIEKKKMKKSEFKAKIKEMILAEYERDVNITNTNPENEVDFLAELEEMLNEEDETTDTTEKDTAETDTGDDVTVDNTETTDVTTTTEVDPNVKAVQDALTQAQAAAEKLGDKKLTDQIGNTITFFTRAHVVEKGAVAESMFPMLKKILK